MDSQVETTHQWRPGSLRGGLTAPVAARELERIAAANGGRLMPADVVKAARPKRSVLHPCFEWDDSEAAEKFREWQARHIIRDVRLVIQYEDERIITPVFVSVRKDDEERSYQRSVDVLSDEDMTERVLEDAKRRLRAIRSDIAGMKRLCDLLPVIQSALEAIEAFDVV